MAVNNDDHPAAGNIQEHLFPHPFTPFLQALGVARRAKPPGTAGKHQQVFLPTVWTADPGKPTAGTAVQAPLRGAKRRGNLMFSQRNHENTMTLRASW